MGHHNQCRALRAVQLQHQLDDLRAGGGIQIAGRLVGKQHFRLGDKCARQCDALLFAAGKMLGQVMGAFAQADLAQGIPGAVARIRITAQFQWQHDIFQRVERR